MKRMGKKKRIISLLLVLALTVTMLPAGTAPAEASSYSGTWWLKVNTQCNVVTAYRREDGKWKPARVMLCSTGVDGATPEGTFYTQGKWNWGELMNDVYGQYCTHITGDVLFHSVYYLEPFQKDSQPTVQFNYLGYTASHGCVRLSVMDAKWIYENCPRGTRVTVYRSSDPGPLGKPPRIIVSQSRATYWDPTDPDPANPYYLLKPPVITISPRKKLEIQYGSRYDLTSRVWAKDPNTFMKLNDLVTVSKVEKWSSKKQRYVTSDFSTKKLGTYKITYKVDDPYSGCSRQTVKLKVVDHLQAPVISGAKNRTVTWGERNVVQNVTAKQASADRTKAMRVLIKAPGKSRYKEYTYEQAQNYRFSREGKYSVKYVVQNKYKPYKEASKTVTITSRAGAINEDPVLTLPDAFQNTSAGSPLSMGTGSSMNLLEGAKAVHNGKNVSGRIQAAVRLPGKKEYTELTGSQAECFRFRKEGLYKIRYSVKNRYTPYQTVNRYAYVRVSTPQPDVPAAPEGSDGQSPDGAADPDPSAGGSAEKREA